MPTQIINSERTFQIWKYTVGHSQLLLRSTKAPNVPTRKQDGYDIFLVLEATVGVNNKGEKVSGEATAVSTFSMGSSEAARWIGKNVRVGAYKARRVTTPQCG